MNIRTTASSIMIYKIMSIELDVLNSYVDKIENDIETSRKSYKSQIKLIEEQKEYVEKGNTHFHSSIEECGGLTNDRHDFVSIFEEYFPLLQWRSALITLCSFFERRMSDLCVVLDREYDIIPEKNKSNNFKDFHEHLKKVIGIKFETNESEFDEIVKIQEVRNGIVHRGGVIDSKIKDYVKANNFFSGEIGEDVIFNKDFLIHIIKSYNAYLLKIASKLKNNKKKVVQ